MGVEESNCVNKHPGNLASETNWSSGDTFTPPSEVAKVEYLDTLSKQCSTFDGCLKFGCMKEALVYILSLIQVDETSATDADTLEITKKAIGVVIKFQCVFLPDQPRKGYGNLGRAFIVANVREKLYNLIKECVSTELKELLVAAIGVASFCCNKSSDCECSVFLPFLKDILAEGKTNDSVRIFNAVNALYGFSIYSENKEVIYNSGILDLLYPLVVHSSPPLSWSVTQLLRSLLYIDNQQKGSAAVRAAVRADGFFEKVTPAFSAFADAGAAAFADSRTTAAGRATVGAASIALAAVPTFTSSTSPLAVVTGIDSPAEALQSLASLVSNMLWWEANKDEQRAAQKAFAESGLPRVMCRVLGAIADLPNSLSGQPTVPKYFTVIGVCITMNATLNNLLHSCLGIFLNNCDFPRSFTDYVGEGGGDVQVPDDQKAVVSVWNTFAAEGLSATTRELRALTAVLEGGMGKETIISQVNYVASVLSRAFQCGANWRESESAPNRYSAAAHTSECRVEDAVLETLALITKLSGQGVTRQFAEVAGPARRYLLQAVLALHVGAVAFEPAERYIEVAKFVGIVQGVPEQFDLEGVLLPAVLKPPSTEGVPIDLADAQSRVLKKE